MATVPRRTANKASPSPSPSSSSSPSSDVANNINMTLDRSREASPARRISPPHLPTPLETIALGIFPFLLVFGTVYSVLSPDTRSSPYYAATQSHSQDPNLAPSYFARKNNIFNVFFVKRGWGWTTFAFVLALLMHPTGKTPTSVVLARRLRAGLRWVAITTWWFFVTQWFFGPPIVDRSFRWTGGKCEVAQRDVAAGEASVKEMFTSVACKAAGGRWNGGHDISGHVFLLVLGTAFLMHEIGWPLLRWSRWRAEERCVITRDGTVESASAEASPDADEASQESAMGAGGKTAVAIMCMNLWMLLMTAIYFHTWFEKFTGLLTAMIGVYAVYYVPRLLPSVRRVVGLPGI